MRSFVPALLGAMIKQFFLTTRRARRNITIVRAVAFAPPSKAYTPAHPVEHISFSIDVDFPERWLALEKRVPVSFERDEAADMIRREINDGVTFGKEAVAFLKLRRRYLNGDDGFHGVTCRLK